MQLTPIYKFKKRELTDSPPDITANNSNWDVLETNLNSHGDSIAAQGKQIENCSKKIENDLVPATQTKLGLVKVGANLSITPDGVLNAGGPYNHPNDANTRHVSDGEKNAWNSKAPGDFGLGGACQPITDVHSISGNGWYMGSNVANAPDTGWWMFFAEVHNPQWIVITATPFTDAEPEKRKMIKNKNNGNWSGWRKYPVGGGIMSVQRGIFDYRGDGANSDEINTYVDINISYIDINKSFVNIYARHGFGSNTRAGVGRLINGTTLRLYNTYSGNGTSWDEYCWEVIEFK